MIGQRIGLPFERRPGISQAFAFTNELGGCRVYFFLQLVSGLDDVFGNFRGTGFFGIFLPLLTSGLQSCLYAFYGPPVLVGRFGQGVELVDGFVARRAVGSRNHDALIFFDSDFLRGFLVSRFDLDGILSGLDEWTARAKAEPCGDGFQLLRCRLRGGIGA